MAGLRQAGAGIEQHYRISQVAGILGVSRGTVYNLLRGEVVIDFTQLGKKGTKLVPESTLAHLLAKKRKVYR